MEEKELKFISKGEKCPFCSKKSFDVYEVPYNIPDFGKALLFIMKCNSCHYKNSDVLLLESKDSVRYSLQIDSIDDMRIRVIKSSEAKISVPGIIDVEGSSMSEGYISNVEGVLLRLINAISFVMMGDIKASQKAKAESHIKKLRNVIEGKDSIQLIIEDMSGNSAIISNKAKKIMLNNS